MTSPAALPYLASRDYDRICQLVRARPSSRTLSYPSLADIEEMMFEPEIQQSTRIWELAEGGLAGYMIVYHTQSYAGFCFEFVYGVQEEALSGQAIDWAEEFFRREYTGQVNELACSVYDYQPERAARLESRGYTRGDDIVLYLERDLALPLENAVVPTGYRIRAVSGEKEDEAWVALHKAAFQTENMSLEKRRAMTSASFYDPGLDLVAVDVKGSLAAYVFGSISPEENALSGRQIGWTDPVATHPDHQRRGLSRVLLLACMQQLRQRGMHYARLGTSSHNLKMQRAAGAVGFQVVEESYQYSKPIQRIKA
jgi:mycothiol synthase